MRAMVMYGYGGPEALSLTDLPQPKPGPGQVVLRVFAHAVNPVDWKLASGRYRPILRTTFPHVPGFDVAGEVVERGPGVTDFPLGQRVHARIAHQMGGACAEFAVVGTDVAVPIPEGLEPGEAAGLPLAGLTALQGLRDHLKIPVQIAKPGATPRLLVVGASGGVGHLVVQLARVAGAYVVGVCSARNAATVLELGAHEVIDYAKPDAYADQAPFDAIYDCVGGPMAPWLARLTPHGRFVSALPGPAVLGRSLLNPVTGRKVHAVMMKSNAEDLRSLDALVTAGKLRVLVDRRFTLAELPQAWERSISGRAVGKVVVEL